MKISGYLEGKIANWPRGTAFPAVPTSLKLALSTADPTDTGGGLVEPTDVGYARQTFTLSLPSTTEGDGSQSSNDVPIVFSATGIGFGTVTHAAIFDQAGNMLFYGPLDAQRVVPNGDTLSFATTTVRVQLTGAFAKFLGEAVINWMRGTTFPAAPASMKLALSRANPLRTGLGIDEPSSGQSYFRQTPTFAVPVTTPGVGTTLETNNALVFGPNTSTDWGVISHWALITDAGQFYSFGALAVPKNITVGTGFGLGVAALSLVIR